MFANLELFKMSSMMASHASRRQALAAQNMANVDTPGYRRMRLAGFSESYAGSFQTAALRTTRSGHVGDSRTSLAFSQIESDKSAPSPDGNTVSLETEMLESINAEREHKRALAVYKSTLNIIHASIGRR